MCSTPRPQQRSKSGQQKSSHSILSSMDAATRLRFAQQANQAQQRREARLAAKQQGSHAVLNAKASNGSNTQQQKQSPTLFYWLTHASVGEFIHWLFTNEKTSVAKKH